MRREWLALITGVLLAACGSTAQPAQSGASRSASVSAAAAASGPIKFSYPQPTAGFMALWLAQDHDLFKKYGLDTEMLNLPAPTDLQALLSGETKFAFEGGTAVAAIAGGADMTFIAAPANQFQQQLYVTPASGIQSVREVIGKSIGASSPGASSDGALHTMLKHEGIAPSQVKIVYLHDDNSIFAALQTGTIEAAVLTKATQPRAKKLGYRLLLDASDLKLPTINAGLLVRRDWAQKNPDAVAAFLKGVMDGTKLSRDDPASTKAEIEKYSRVSDTTQLQQLYEESLTWVPYPLVQEAGVQTLIDLSSDEKVKAHKAADFYDNSYLLKLQDWVKQLYPERHPELAADTT